MGGRLCGGGQLLPVPELWVWLVFLHMCVGEILTRNASQWNLPMTVQTHGCPHLSTATSHQDVTIHPLASGTARQDHLCCRISVSISLLLLFSGCSFCARNSAGKSHFGRSTRLLLEPPLGAQAFSGRKALWKVQSSGTQK